jgi:hypothetical protein
VSHPFSEVFQCTNYLQPGLSIEYKPQLLAGFENVLIIVYQRHSNANALILDKSSQDRFLRGFSFGNKISLLRCGGLLSPIHVTFKSQSTLKGKPDQINKRRRHASNSGIGNRAIHQKNFQRNHDWGRELNNGK